MSAPICNRHIRLLRTPTYIDIAPASRLYIEASCAALEDLGDIPIDFLRPVFGERTREVHVDDFEFSGPLKKLEHRLSNARVRATGPRRTYRLDSAMQERACASNLGPHFGHQLMGSFEEFKSGLARAATGMLGEENPIRDGFNVFTVRGDDGVSWMFSDYLNLDDQLAWLHDFLRERIHIDPPIFVAAAFMGLFLTAHPFRDGNGRTSRLLFNVVLREAFRHRDIPYIPLKNFMDLSRHGFEIRLHQAQVLGRWSPLVRWCCDAIGVMSHWKQSGHGPNSW